MSHKFQAATDGRGEVTYVRLEGVIDEDNALSSLVSKVTSGPVVIDFARVRRINSCGVRDWVNWVNEVEANAADIVLVACSPAIVAQVNLVHNFVGKGVVKSLYLPFYCEDCDEERLVLVQALELGDGTGGAPDCLCETCGESMAFDDMPDSYFSFLAAQNSSDVADSAPVVAAIEELAGKSEDRQVASGGSAADLAALESPDLPTIETGEAKAPETKAAPTLRPPTAAPEQSAPTNFTVSFGGILPFVLVGVLVAAIGTLALLLISS